MFQLICRQRGCSLRQARLVPLLCPVCNNPLVQDDQEEVSHAKNPLMRDDPLVHDDQDDVSHAKTTPVKKKE